MAVYVRDSDKSDVTQLQKLTAPTENGDKDNVTPWTIKTKKTEPTVENSSFIYCSLQGPHQSRVAIGPSLVHLRYAGFLRDADYASKIKKIYTYKLPEVETGA